MKLISKAVGTGIKAKNAIIATTVILGVCSIAVGCVRVKNMNPSEATVSSGQIETHSILNMDEEMYTEIHSTKEDTEKEQNEKNKEWMTSYKNFLLNYDSQELINQPIKERQATLESGGTVKGFFLYDFNSDGQPELMVQKVYGRRVSGTLLYTYNSEKKTVEKYGNNIYLQNEAGDTLFDGSEILSYNEMNGNGLLLYDGCEALGYRKDDGRIVSFFWPGVDYTVGAGFRVYMQTDINLSIYDVYEESFDYGWVSGKKSVEQKDKTLYQDTMNNYVPFMFRSINIDNINKYVVEDYRNSGMYTYTVEECKVFYSKVDATN